MFDSNFASGCAVVISFICHGANSATATTKDRN
jgi:hypothetical protein